MMGEKMFVLEDNTFAGKLYYHKYGQWVLTVDEATWFTYNEIADLVLFARACGKNLNTITVGVKDE